jgi:predicted acyltransferase
MTTMLGPQAVSVESSTEAVAVPRPRSTRFAALDALRGSTIAGMILVNNQGSGAHAFWGMAHADWNGWNLADLVFPGFLFMVGVSMAYSFARRRPPLGKVVRRAALLVLLGLVLNGFPYGDLHELRLTGVLQRIGLAYLLASLLVLHAGFGKQARVAAVILLGYWAVSVLPVPGHSAFQMTPAVSVPGHLDRVLLGPTHIYKNTTYDPEGLLATLPAMVSVLAGWWAGCWLRRQDVSARTARGLGSVGLLCIGAGLAWGAAFPVNKRLWTSSFVVLAAGFALVALAGWYRAVELRGRLARPFVVLGRNALVVFMATEQLAYFFDRYGWRRGLYSGLFSHAGYRLGSLLYGLMWVAGAWAVCWALDRRRIYVKI